MCKNLLQLRHRHLWLNVWVAVMQISICIIILQVKFPGAQNIDPAVEHARKMRVIMPMNGHPIGIFVARVLPNKAVSITSFIKHKNVKRFTR
jgi:hypothetical protein